MIKDPEKQEDGTFLSRWSRRKLDDKRQTEPLMQIESLDSEQPPVSLNTITPRDSNGALLPVTEVEQLAGEQGEKLKDTPDLTDEDMPPVESLDENSDYSGFMSPGVSDKLRKLALRKLFAGKGFNVRDGLDDYDDDFTNFEPLGDIITSDMKHQAELAEQRKKEAEEKAEAERLAGEVEKEDESLKSDDEDQIESDDGPESQPADTKQTQAVVSTDETENREKEQSNS
jgi:hypothetical protein